MAHAIGSRRRAATRAKDDHNMAQDSSSSEARAPAGPDVRFISQLTSGTYGLILAGGRGSRLMQLTDWRAKPAVPFGGKFRIIDFPLSNCVNSGIRRIGVATQYKSHSLIRHLQRGWSFLDGRLKEFIDLLPAQQRVRRTPGTRAPPTPSTRTWTSSRANNPEYVLILAGDHVYKMDYGRMLAYHVSRQADMTVACIEVPLEEATRLRRDGRGRGLRVRSFLEKPRQPAVHSRATRSRARQHGHLCLQRQVPVRAARPRRRRPELAATTSARTSSRIWCRAIVCLRTASSTAAWA